MHKILITGGFGFIGSHLYEKLKDENNIVILDNLANLNGKKIDSTIENKKHLIIGDIRDKKIVNQIMNDIDIVIHLAAQINVTKSIDNPIVDADHNINGTLNILDACREFDVERFIYASSAAVYGKPIYLPIDEDHPTYPISPYGLSKLTSERYSMLYHDLYNINTTCLRFFNVFGPGQINNSYSGVITKFIQHVKNDSSPVIFGDGNQTRDFVYIDDIVSAILLCIKNNKAIGKVFNIGTGKPITIKDLANTIIKISDKDLNIIFENYRVGDIIESYSDITKAKNILGFEQRYSLENGLRLCF